MTKYKAGDLVRIKENAQVGFNPEEEPIEVNADKDVTMPINSLKGRSIKLKALEEITITYPDTGFNPENLTFDGVEIKEGDRVCLGWEHDIEYTVTADRIPAYTLFVDLNEDNSLDYVHSIPLYYFNITAHYPAKDKGLERLQSELIKIVDLIDNAEWEVVENGEQVLDDLLNRYYQARLALEEYKAKNG